MEEDENEISLFKPDYASLLVEFLKTDSTFVDFVVECSGKQQVKCHGCVLKSQFNVTGNSIRMNLPKDIVKSFVEFCYTGKLRANSSNLLYYIEGAVLLNSKPELIENLKKYLHSNIASVLEQESLIRRLPEVTLRRAVLQALPLKPGMLLLFKWWSADLKKRRKAYVEMVEELQLKHSIVRDETLS